MYCSGKSFSLEGFVPFEFLMAQEVAIVVAFTSVAFDSVWIVIFPSSVFFFQDTVGSKVWNHGIPKIIRSFPKFVT